MKYLIALLFVLFSNYSSGQFFNEGNASEYDNDSEKYLSFNPLGLAEPFMALGIGVGNRFSRRSEYFSELSYLAQSPIFRDLVNSIHGFRFIGQYRYYYFSKKRKAIISLFPPLQKRTNSNAFVGLEIRVKGYSFSNRNSFINHATNDTLQNFLYKANAKILGAAIIVGETYTISANEKWKVDVVFGLGGKQKIVTYKNVPDNYKVLRLETREPAIVPPIYKSVGTPSISFAVRLQFVFD